MSAYLTVVEVVAIHDLLLERHGGSAGLRDLGALEAAVFRPMSGYYEDVVAEAAALLESLAVNHAFVDGNKRTAFAAADVFLRLNDQRIVVESRAAYDFLVGLFERREFGFERLEPWLRQHVEPM